MLELKELSKDFGGLRAVNKVSFHVKEGQLTSLIGPNGSGKTTMFNMISGVFPPSEGSIVLAGQNINGLRSDQIVNLGVCRTFQELRVFNSLTVIENVMIGLHVRAKSGIWGSTLRLPSERQERKLLRQKAMQLLELMRIADKRNLMPSSLPYAEQRMIDIARALASGVRVLLLDEPAAGMNPNEKQRLADILVKIQKEICNTVFLIEHDMKFVMSISEYIGVLNFGTLIAEGVPEEIKKNQDVIQAYLGTD